MGNSTAPHQLGCWAAHPFALHPTAPHPTLGPRLFFAFCASFFSFLL